jgi:hypothetical protein
MAQERYIDADALINKLQMMYIPYPTISVPYTGGTMDQAINNVLQSTVPGAVNQALTMFRDHLIAAIQETATLKGTPCFLCKQRDCDELPARVHI